MNYLAQIFNPVINSQLGRVDTFHEGSVPLGNMISNLITVALGVGGVIFFIIFLWGAVEYIIAGSDKEAVQKATKKITNGIIGLVLLLSIFVISYLVETLFGFSVLNFTVPTFTT